MILDTSVNVDLNQLVDKLVKLGQPLAAHVWEIFVRQEIAYGIIHTLYAVIALAVIVVLYRAAKRAVPMFQEGVREDERVVVPFVVWMIFAFLAFTAGLIGVGYLEDGILHLANPEYFAIKDILGR